MKISAEFIRAASVALIASVLFASCQTRHKGCDAYDKLHQAKKTESQAAQFKVRVSANTK
ncbi:MAG: hypothetical protein ACKOZY_09135 [Flavobacteriales bacterium]